MRMVTTHLSRSVEAEPPASLRAGVLDRLAGVAQEPSRPLPAVTAVPAAVAPPVAPTRTPTQSQSQSQSQVSDLGERRARREHRAVRQSKVPFLVAAAALVIAGAVGGWGLQNHHEAQQASDQNTQIINLLGSSDVQTATSKVAGGGSGTVIVSSSTNRAAFVAAGLPKLDGSKVYELWTIKGSPVPAGTFTSAAGATLISLPAAAVTASQVAMTVEPKGGSKLPTTPALMAVAVPQAS